MYMASGPDLHDYYKKMNKEVLSKYDVMSLAEGAGNAKINRFKFC
jgi:oligo-1,6-glucosidase